MDAIVSELQFSVADVDILTESKNGYFGEAVGDEAVE
jgi:hypothetical protein